MRKKQIVNELEMSTLTINELYDFRDHMKMDIMHILMTVNFNRTYWINFLYIVHIIFFLFFKTKEML